MLKLLMFILKSADTATSNAISGAIAALDLANTYITSTESSNNIKVVADAVAVLNGADTW